MNSYIDEPMIECFVFETSSIVETLEQLMIKSENNKSFTEDDINEIFRLMHTIKGSAAMMMFDEMTTLAHKIEDFFYRIRDDNTLKYDFTLLTDIILESVDFFKIELMKVKNKEEADGNSVALTTQIEDLLKKMMGESFEAEEKPIATQQYYIRTSEEANKIADKAYKAKIFFEEGCGMENIRAYTIIHNIKDLVNELYFWPSDVINNDETAEYIQSSGLDLIMDSKVDEEELKKYLESTLFLKSLVFEKVDNETYTNLKMKYNVEEIDSSIKVPEISIKFKEKPEKVQQEKESNSSDSSGKSIISVNVDKLDKLMDMVGELVIAEAMVTQNPILAEMEIESFEKSSRQLHKITSELQDLVMAIRMVPLSTTFMKMHRIVRDMSKKLEKKVDLEVIGEETEVDKNIIEKISDPLMHIMRNAIDHGLESTSDRMKKGKNQEGKIRLEAKNSGSDVLVIITDDGKGLDKEIIYQKGYTQGLVNSPMESMSDSDIFNLILEPGFSTNEDVTEFSGRGVGMDVVSKNIEGIGGRVLITSIPNKGTTIILKIPLTLAIIEGMNIKVGESRFTLPIMSIQESFRPEVDSVFKDTEGNEMIMVRGICYPIVRLHEFYDIETQINTYDKGILLMVEENDKSCCLFADELIGQQQVVVKALPPFIKKYNKVSGISGCTLLGDGNISLILNVSELR